ncbi:MAG: HAD family phosphatase [Caldiserica bacterium]|nr:HAD family phosphatase [Caldisericota bacterium]
MENDIKAIIFDLDGTLIDSMQVWDRIGIEFLSSRGIAVPDDLGKVVKNMSMTESASYYKQQFKLSNMTGDEIIACWIDMVYRHYANDIPLKSGVLQFVTGVKKRGFKISVATASDIKLVTAVLSRHGILELFDAIVTVKEIGKGKDFPDIFLECTIRMGVSPGECLVFEDCLHAVKTAASIGMKTIAVYDLSAEHEMDELKEASDRFIFNFSELEEG